VVVVVVVVSATVVVVEDVVVVSTTVVVVVAGEVDDVVDVTGTVVVAAVSSDPHAAATNAMPARTSTNLFTSAPRFLKKLVGRPAEKLDGKSVLDVSGSPNSCGRSTGSDEFRLRQGRYQ